MSAGLAWQNCPTCRLATWPASAMLSTPARKPDSKPPSPPGRQLTAGRVTMPAAGRPRRRAASMSRTMRPGSVRTCIGLTWITNIPAPVSEACLRMVASQVAGSKCQLGSFLALRDDARDISAVDAREDDGEDRYAHRTDDRARLAVVPVAHRCRPDAALRSQARSSRVLNIGRGRLDVRTRAWKSPSAAERTPSATSASTARS